MADLGQVGTAAFTAYVGMLPYLRRQYHRTDNKGGVGGNCGIGATMMRADEPSRPRHAKRTSWRRQIVGETQLNGTPSNLQYTLFRNGHVVGSGTSTGNQIDLYSLYEGSYEVWIHGNGTKRSETWGPTTISLLSPLTLSGTLAPCTAGVAYSSGLTSTGGKLPVTWKYSGTLPTGLSFNTSTGVISGTASGSPIVGSYKLCITVTAADGVPELKDVVLVVS